MANIEAKSGGTVDKVLDTIKSIADKFFNFLSNLDSNPKYKNKIKNVKQMKSSGKTSTSSFDYNVDGKLVPIIIESTQLSDGVFNLKFYVNSTAGKNSPVEFKNVKITDDDAGVDTWNKYTDKALEQLITKEVKQEFDIKTAKQINVRLHKVVGSKESSVVLSGIKASFDSFGIAEAEDMLDTALNNDAFVEVLTETPTDYSIVEVGDAFEIADCSPDDYIDYIESALQCVMCATLNYYMEMQTMDWSAARSVELHAITGNQLWRAQDNLRFFGDLSIELLDKVFNPFVCSASFSEFKEYALGEVTKEDIREAILRYVAVLDMYSCNFSPDIASSIENIIRELKHTANFELKMN